MTPLGWLVHPYAAAAGWVLLLAFWQTTTMALAFAAWRHMTGTVRVNRIYVGGVLSLAAMVVVVVATAVATTIGPQISAPVVAAPRAALDARPVVVDPDPPQMSAGVSPRAASLPAVSVGALGVLWLVGSVCLLLRVTGEWLAVVAVRRDAAVCRDARLVARVASLAAGRPSCERIAVLESSRVAVPMVAGWRRPTLILPPGFSSTLAAEECDAVLAHEVAHISRRDYAVNLLQRLAEALLFFSPAVHWVSLHVRHAREFCCDDAAVLQSGGRPLVFATALETLAHAELARRRTVGLAIVAPPIASRVRRLLQGEPQRSPAWSVAFIAALLVVAMSGVSRAMAGFDAARIAVAGVGVSRQPQAPTPAAPPAATPVAIESPSPPSAGMNVKPTAVTPNPRPLSAVPLASAALSDVPEVTAPAPQDAAFEVASIRANPSGRLGFKNVRITGDRMTLTNASLMQLVVMAYGSNPDLVAGGPDWKNDDGFDVEAKAERPFASAEERQAMLRSLLLDRFKLAVHREPRETSTATLTIARGDGRLGAGLRPAQTSCKTLMAARTPEQPPNPCGMTASALITGQMNARGLPFLSLLSMIERDLRHPVVDNTGLTGEFDWEMRWTPLTFRMNPDFPRDRFPLIDPDGPGIGTALEEQLGLKLVTGRAPVEFLVIDSVQRPTEN